MSPKQLQTELELLKSALYQPRLYVNNFLDELINEINIQSQMALINETTDKKELHNQQEQMTKCITEFKETCLSYLSDDHLPKEHLQTTIENIEIDLNSDNSNLIIKEIRKNISDSLLSIQKIIFNNKSIHYINNTYCCDLKEYDKKHLLLGILLIIEDEFINKETLQKA